MHTWLIQPNPATHQSPIYSIFCCEVDFSPQSILHALNQYYISNIPNINYFSKHVVRRDYFFSRYSFVTKQQLQISRTIAVERPYALEVVMTDYILSTPLPITTSIVAIVFLVLWLSARNKQWPIPQPQATRLHVCQVCSSIADLINMTNLPIPEPCYSQIINLQNFQHTTGSGQRQTWRHLDQAT